MAKKLAKSEKRVIIAKDVLKWLRAPQPNNITVAGGTYFSLVLAQASSDDARDSISTGISNCVVCALGACFLSHIRVFDEVRSSEISESPGRRFFADRLLIESKMPYFSIEQMRLIEAVFEGLEQKFRTARPAHLAIMAFHKNTTKNGAQKTRERLIAIMKNIIKNDGKFKP